MLDNGRIEGRNREVSMDTRCELCIGIEDKPAIAIVTITDMENTVKQRVQLCEDCLDNLADLLR